MEPSCAADSTTLTRLNDTIMPDSGAVTYTGTCAALYSVVGSRETSGHMFGQARLDVDFASNTSSGLIHSRTNSGGTAATDIVLEVGTLEDGGFSGTTTRGRIRQWVYIRTGKLLWVDRWVKR